PRRRKAARARGGSASAPACPPPCLLGHPRPSPAASQALWHSSVSTKSDWRSGGRQGPLADLGGVRGRGASPSTGRSAARGGLCETGHRPTFHPLAGRRVWLLVGVRLLGGM